MTSFLLFLCVFYIHFSKVDKPQTILYFLHFDTNHTIDTLIKILKLLPILNLKKLFNEYFLLSLKPTKIYFDIIFCNV